MRLIDADALSKDICDYIEHMTEIGIIVDGEGLWGKLNDALDKAPTISEGDEWIPVSERMPKNDFNVLVTVHFKGVESKHIKPCYYVEVASQYNGEWFSFSDPFKGDRDLHEVIAWKYLPKPYKWQEE